MPAFTPSDGRWRKSTAVVYNALLHWSYRQSLQKGNLIPLLLVLVIAHENTKKKLSRASGPHLHRLPCSQIPGDGRCAREKKAASVIGSLMCVVCVCGGQTVAAAAAAAKFELENRCMRINPLVRSVSHLPSRFLVSKSIAFCKGHR